MGVLPEPIEELLATALVGELTVLDEEGRLVTHPLIPFYDGELIYLTSSVLFSRKLEHIKANPKVSISISDPTAVDVDPFRRATIQGDATVDDADLHAGWERWSASPRASARHVYARMRTPSRSPASASSANAFAKR